MIIKDLLTKCSLDDIVSGIMEIASVDEERRADVYKTHKDFMEHLQSIEPMDTGHIAFGILHRTDGTELPDLSLFSKAEILEKFNLDSEWKDIMDIDMLPDDEVEHYVRLSSMPDSYAYTLSPWSEVLGYEVDESSAQEIGIARFLSSAIYNMTFFGFTEDQLSHERKKLEESIAELEEIEKLPKEERDKHFKSAEEVFAELGWKDERTEDEKEQERCILYREVLVNQIRTYRVLENFIKKDKSGTSFL